MTEARLKIAVFIDFDNIEIGVKTTLNQQFDIAAILEGIKERGEVVTKVAYGDWKRAGEHGRLLSQHAIRMVQRNLTPGGDKNGADINLALDALEMAFTHDHINAFVIVGGDSDFITLVEKLKQYDKKVFVVGGRQFTSFVMQKNCHEFIAYENLVGGRRQSSERRTPGSPASGATDLSKALPLVKRALKILVDREVAPQLGLLKSTLLQLDSTFSERDYGASTFRDFIEKVAQTGLVTLRHSGRSLLVDLPEDGGRTAAAVPEPSPAPSPAEPAEPPAAASQPEGEQPRQPSVQPDPEQAVQRVRELFARAQQTPRWPMYVRQVKQFLRAADDGFDERKYGFQSIVDLLRAAQREAVFRLERDRQGVLRVFPGANLQQRPAPVEPHEGEAAAPEPAVEQAESYGPMAEMLSQAEEPALGVETSPATEAEPGVSDDVPEAREEQLEKPELQFDEAVSQPSPVTKRRGGRKGASARGTRKAAAARPATRRRKKIDE